MIKRGITLIEVVVVLSLILLLASIGLGSLNSILSLKDNIEKEQVIYEIIDSIIYAKTYCNDVNRSGKITISKYDNGYYFVFNCADGEKLTKEFRTDLKIYKDDFIEELTFLNLSVSNKGIVNSNTIRILDKKGNKYGIIISVGVNRVYLKVIN